MKNTSPDRVAVEEGVVVGEGGGRPLLADVFTPPGPRANGAGVLLIHGGGWSTGDRKQLHGYGILIGRLGYTCVACEYRLSGEAIWPAQIEDVTAAFAWMRSNAGALEIDRDRIAVEGNSAGAHLSLMLAARATDKVAACIAIYPPTDLTLRAADAERMRAMRSELTAVDPSSQLLGGGDRKLREEASPISYVSANMPPTMLIHGNADTVVSVEHSLRMYRALVDAGAKAELHVFEGQPHAFDREPAFGRQCASLMTLFLSRYLVPAPVAAK